MSTYNCYWIDTMSSLKYVDKEVLEKIFEMSGGYVLNFSDRSFTTFFNDFSIDITNQKYAKYGSSKANRLRTFWEIETDTIVASVIDSLLDLVLTLKDRCIASDPSFLKAKEITYRLIGKSKFHKIMQDETEEDFLEKKFKNVSLSRLDINPNLLPILEKRLEEVNKCLKGNIPISCIFLIGSILEGLLLDTASKSPSKFNESNCCPKDKNGKVLSFPDWKLAQFIDVSHDIGLIKLDVKKHSHSIRDFRNYIHPYQQMDSNFDPDIHTAKICLQVLKAVIADLSRER